MKKNSKVIVLERKQFAMLIKTHRKSLLIINVLTHICQTKKIRLTMTIEEACQVLKLDATFIEKQKEKGDLRFSEESGICFFEINDLVRLKNATEMVTIYRQINAASVLPTIK